MWYTFHTSLKKIELRVKESYVYNLETICMRGRYVAQRQCGGRERALCERGQRAGVGGSQHATTIQRAAQPPREAAPAGTKRAAARGHIAPFEIVPLTPSWVDHIYYAMLCSTKRYSIQKVNMKWKFVCLNSPIDLISKRTYVNVVSV